jgi:hypothetical protein
VISYALERRDTSLTGRHQRWRLDWTVATALDRRLARSG